ncbi:MAG: TIGR03984 family CRISPR-associated protein [wastewater metagenome]|nr:TIGR03984 family CRISPR-associated protein [Candidatus Loosdrechtia aerotolerans]
MEEANGLQLQEIKSQSNPFPIDNIETMENLEKCIAAQIQDKSYVVAYLDYKVLIGTFENRGFHFFQNEEFDPKYIQKIRVFNQTQELYLWRSSDGMRGRYRTDEEGKETFVVDAEQVLFGTKAEPPDGGFTKITETRGTELTLPFSNLSVDDKRSRVFIKTRNYIDYNEVKQATYVDCRFMGFWNNGKELT